MAAPPVKSQPLHNFSLPDLKWAHKSISSAAAPTSQSHRSRHRDSPDQQQRRHPDIESDGEGRSTDVKEQQPSGGLEKDAGSAGVELEGENGEVKPWKLRPRKEIMKAAASSKKEIGEGGCEKKGNSNTNGVKSQRVRGTAEGGQQHGGVEKKAKRRVWISLSKEEIEEDIYALTGGRPARRPKKWPKNVQKQLDNVFPGLYLVGVAADSYRVTMLCAIREIFPKQCPGWMDSMQKHRLWGDSIKCYIARGSIEQGKRIHRHAFSNRYEPKTFLINTLLNMDATFHLLGEAQALFDQMHERNVVSWTTMNAAYSNAEHNSKALYMLIPNVYTHTLQF